MITDEEKIIIAKKLKMPYRDCDRNLWDHDLNDRPYKLGKSDGVVYARWKWRLLAWIPEEYAPLSRPANCVVVRGWIGFDPRWLLDNENYWG